MVKRKTYGVVRADNIKSASVGHIFSVIGEEDEILENGMVGNLGDYRTHDKDILGNTIEREVRDFKKVEGNEEPLVLIAHNEIRYEQYVTIDNSLEYFYVPVGRPARAYELTQHDTYSVSQQMIKALDEGAGVKVGNFVEPEAGERILKEVEEKPTGAFIGKVVRKDTLGTSTIVGQAGLIKRPIELIVIEVQKNSL